MELDVYHRILPDLYGSEFGTGSSEAVQFRRFLVIVYVCSCSELMRVTVE